MLQEQQCPFIVESSQSIIVAKDYEKPREVFQSDMLPSSQSLMILSDKQNGSLVLCQQDSMVTRRRRDNEINKFIISLSPKVICLPNIYPDFETNPDAQVQKLIDSFLIRSPADHLLSTSEQLIVTLHTESADIGRIRLWNMDDGRCIMISSQALLEKKRPRKLHKLDQGAYPGYVLCVCEDAEILVINVYTMTCIATTSICSGEIHSVKVNDYGREIELQILDTEGKVKVYHNNPSTVELRSSSKSQRFRQKSNLMLDQCELDLGKAISSQLAKNLKFQDSTVGQGSTGILSQDRMRGRGKHVEILCFQALSNPGDRFMVVYQDRIELVKTSEPGMNDGYSGSVLVQIEHEVVAEDARYDFSLSSKKKKVESVVEKWLVCAQFTQFKGKHYLLCINSDLDLLIYNVQELVNEGSSLVPFKLALFGKSTRMFSLVSKLVDTQMKKTLLQTQEELKAEKLQTCREYLLKEITSGKLGFNYCEQQHLLYIFQHNDEGQQMVAWHLEDAFRKQDPQHCVLPFCTSPVDIFGIKSSYHDPNCIININQFLAKNQFRKFQHSFFYSDEKITEQTFYASQDFPSMIIGTNYGRVFIIQLFQDIEGRAYPLVVLDSHEASPITSLFLCYSSARRIKAVQNVPGSDQSAQVSLDTGGHLIACSEDGTISVTNMSSPEIIDQLTNFSISRNEREKVRVDKLLKERSENRHMKRRNSFSSMCSTHRYFNLVRATPLKVFRNCSFGAISKIFEVKVLQQLQLENQKYMQQMVTEQSRAQKDLGHDPALGVAGRHGEIQEQSTHSHKRTASADRLQEEEVAHHNPSQPVKSVKDITLMDPLASNQQSPLIKEAVPFKASYACVDAESKAVYVLQIINNACDMLKIQGLDSTPIGVYEDALQNLVHVVTESHLNVYTYNRRSRQFLRKSDYTFALNALQISHILFTLLEKQQYFKHQTKLSQQSKQPQVYDQYSFEQLIHNELNMQASKSQAASTQPSGHHKVLDYLSLSLSLPLYYHPHNSLTTQKFTKKVKDMLQYKQLFKQALNSQTNSQAIVDSMRIFIKQKFVYSERYMSDFSQEYYNAQGAVTPMMTGFKKFKEKTFRQQMIIINTKDMINIFKSRIKAYCESIGKVAKGEGSENAGSQSENSHRKQPDGDHHHDLPNISAEFFQNSKWPTRLLALVHPFSLDENLDENLELFFGLSIPFVDFRIGVQGTDEAFSFIIAKDEKEKDEKEEGHQAIQQQTMHFEENINLLKLSRIQRVKNDLSQQIGHDRGAQPESSLQVNRMAFVNSEYWKTTSYMSTIMSSYFLSTLVSIVEFAQSDITTLIQDWLNVVQYITSLSSNQGSEQQGQNPSEAMQALQALSESLESSAKPLSISALSQLMLRKDASISSCARDVIIKPLFSSGQSIDYIKAEINQWQDLIIDTYLKLKEDSNTRQTVEESANFRRVQTGGPNTFLHSNSQGSESLDQIGQHSRTDSEGMHKKRELEFQRRAGYKKGGAGNLHEKSINHFFGELEVRGLINLSYFALYSMDEPEKYKIEVEVQNRLCKCSVILMREIMEKFRQNNKEHQNLLTILMQLLQTQMRAQVPQFQTKVIKEDVIIILLLVYDFYKKQLRDEKFLTRVVAENFHLIHPKNSELYLKLTAAKTLLEIGTYFPEDFLQLIHEEATTLEFGPEYQKNVLDVLRYFINGSKDNLHPYLIHIVQTLLKCLNPNDEQLRKNSTQIISIILSTMVKNFPMIAFHHETQRLAVGTPTGHIAIYDVRTSDKWKILEGHVHNVNSVEFDIKGNMLASYSASDLTLRLWKVGNASFFSTILGGAGKSTKEIRLNPLKQSKDGAPAMHKVSKRQPGSARAHHDKHKSMKGDFMKCKVRFVNNDKAIELTREDATVEFHRLHK